MNKKLNKNVIYSLLKSFSQMIFPMITFPYISRVLQAENVGKINFSNSIVGYVSLLASLGLTTYAVRECSKVKNNRERLSQLSSELISINLITTLIAYGGLLIILICFKPLNNYRFLIMILSMSVFFTTLGADWLNTAMEDFGYITIRVFIFQLFSIISMILFVKTPSDYYKYAIITVISTSGANIMNILYRKKYCEVKFTFKIDWKRHIKPIITLFALILSQNIFLNSDITILGLLRGDFEVGLYSTSVKIYNLINTMIASIAWVVMPQMSFLFEQKNYDEINKLFKFSANFIFILGIPCVVGLNLYSSEIIQVIAGNSFANANVSLKILSFALLVSLIAGLLGNIILLPEGKDNICLKACSISAVFNIISNLILIPLMGLNAAAMTTLFSQLIVLIIYYINMNPKIYLENKKEIILQPIIASSSIILLKYVINCFYQFSILVFLISICLTVIIYFSILILLNNTFIMSYFKSLVRKGEHKK
ncbi:flippase [Thomasclavelia ramosa]|uniref:flippase n=1 Tax=Thomasclavelia ramosa TaxID=1547 RepID=UPI0022DFEE6F|nr:flippase [Thomasclavelia ramosa]